ncbi:hypothetical protein [Microtetraspora sp. NBRC 16547]|uniref:hypothetical protein n=1 Tax=Microtetraspora sp. NBRC 16547 TaxID=3030993 RepID=UPI0024A338BF|nr:hypothetical protein [Microtetraspora sp. NBRC 16547]GLX00160.1 lipoprotein [Microtetraspora sp. NBRC 16547]
MKRFAPVTASLAVPLVAAQLVAGAAAASTAASTAPSTVASTAPSTVASTAVSAVASTVTPRPVRVPSGVTAGYVVFDRQAGRVIANHQVHRRFRSASIVKILIAIDYLERQKDPIPARDAALLAPMLRGSDDDAATALWRRGGQGRIVQRMARKIGLTDTAPPPAAKPGFWGYTAISAIDIARVYRYLLDKAEPRVRDVVMGHLRQAQQCATDGFDQYFGIPRGVPRPWAVKQGWSGYGSVPPVKCVREAATSSALAPADLASTATGPRSTNRSTNRAVADGSAGRSTAVAATAAGLAAKETATASLKRGNPVDFNRPVLHTTGVIGDRFIMVVLTTQPAGASFGSSATRLTALARDLYRSVS